MCICICISIYIYIYIYIYIQLPTANQPPGLRWSNVYESLSGSVGSLTGWLLDWLGGCLVDGSPTN